MFTSFVEVKKELFSLSKEVVKIAKQLVLLENAVILENNEMAYDKYVASYRSFNEVLKQLVGCESNNLIVWRLNGESVQICVLDYYDDGSILKVVHWPTEEELDANGVTTLIGSSIEITTFDEYAEETDLFEVEQINQALTIDESKKDDDQDGELMYG